MIRDTLINNSPNFLLVSHKIYQCKRREVLELQAWIDLERIILDLASLIFNVYQSKKEFEKKSFDFDSNSFLYFRSFDLNFTVVPSYLQL